MNKDHKLVSDCQPSVAHYLQTAENSALQSLIHVDAEINHYIHQYAAPTCLSLCEGIQEKLPRELRDMIYGFVLQENPKVRLRKEHFEHELFDSRLIIPLVGRAERLINLGYDNISGYAHLFDTGFVDPNTKSEFTEAWYWPTTFSFLEHKYIGNLLHYDRWGSDIQPQSPGRSVIGSAGPVTLVPAEDRIHHRHVPNRLPLIPFGHGPGKSGERRRGGALFVPDHSAVEKCWIRCGH
jgi:hypothetical protein